MAGFFGNPQIGCAAGTENPCDPNPCGLNAACENDRGNPICFCPKGLTGNPFAQCSMYLRVYGPGPKLKILQSWKIIFDLKICTSFGSGVTLIVFSRFLMNFCLFVIVPDGEKCQRNSCGVNAGCRMVNGRVKCFCLPGYEGNPPSVPCALPTNPCDPSPCGPNTQCTVLDNGLSKCTCLAGFIESPNTIRGCVKQTNPCEPNPCGTDAICDASRVTPCYCPENTVGNPYKSCSGMFSHNHHLKFGFEDPIWVC